MTVHYRIYGATGDTNKAAGGVKLLPTNVLAKRVDWLFLCFTKDTALLSMFQLMVQLADQHE